MPGTKLFSWGFPAQLTTSTSWINVCSRSWGYIGKRKGKGEIKTDRERENGEGGQVGDNKMSVFCFLRKAIQTSRVAHFAKHLTLPFSSCASDCCHELCIRGGTKKKQSVQKRQARLRTTASSEVQPPFPATGDWLGVFWKAALSKSSLAFNQDPISLHSTVSPARTHSEGTWLTAPNLLPMRKPGWPEGWQRHGANLGTVLSLTPWI